MDHAQELKRLELVKSLCNMTREELENFSQTARGKVSSSIDAILDKALELKSK